MAYRTSSSGAALQADVTQNVRRFRRWRRHRNHHAHFVIVDGSLHTRAGVNDLAILSDALVQSLASVQRTTTLQTRAEHQLGIVIAHAANPPPPAKIGSVRDLIFQRRWPTMASTMLPSFQSLTLLSDPTGKAGGARQIFDRPMIRGA